MLAAVLLLCLVGSAAAAVRTVTVFGATSGVGQLVTKQLLAQSCVVNAVTRNAESARQFDNLAGSRILQADTRDSASLRQKGLFDADAVVISVGTTAFPSAKWEGQKNTPRTACLDSVASILDALEERPRSSRPSRVVLLSSIGVERAASFPFKILNSYGVLGYKLQSEQLLLERARRAGSGYSAIVVRPGRLVGAPFTNSDLAKLLQLDQGSNKGIAVAPTDTLAGDVERTDVATAVVRLLGLGPDFPGPGGAVLSVVNKPGRAPTPREWDVLLSESQFSGYEQQLLL